MTLSDLVNATAGQTPPACSLLKTVSDDTRRMDIYMHSTGALVVALWPTLGNLYVDPGESFKHWLWQSQDWFKNLDFRKVRVVAGGVSFKVHEGFYREALSFLPEIELQLATSRATSVIIGGFSQGAAHATLLHIILRAAHPGLTVTTRPFASPRSLSWLSAPLLRWFANHKSTGSTYKVIVAHGDPVPHLPLVLMGFAHLAKPTKLGEPVKGWDPVALHTTSHYASLLGDAPL